MIEFSNKPLRLKWSEQGDGLTSATADIARGGKILLMADVLPDGSWEWTAWKAIRMGEF
jgi:hypothetical protein